MTRKRIPVRTIKEVLRLVHDRKLSERKTAQAVGICRAAVSDYLARAKLDGLSWPLPDGLDDARLEAMLFKEEAFSAPRSRPLPD